jgi:hypothetical protein
MNGENAGEVQKSRSGWKTISIAMALLFIAALGGLLLMVLPPKEPSYNGKPLSYWLTNFGEGFAGDTTKDPKILESRRPCNTLAQTPYRFCCEYSRPATQA